jgi:hypothetical protein
LVEERSRPCGAPVTRGWVHPNDDDVCSSDDGSRVLLRRIDYGYAAVRLADLQRWNWLAVRRIDFELQLNESER